MCLKNMHGYLSYSWIDHQKRTHFTSICRETERATTDLNITMKSPRLGASNGAWTQAQFLFFEVFLNDNFPNNDNGAWLPAQLDAPRRKL